MRVTILSHGMQFGQYISLRFAKQVDIVGPLTDNLAVTILHDLGLFEGKAYQATDDGDGFFMIGKRKKPIAVLICEGHPQFENRIIFAPKKM